MSMSRLDQLTINYLEKQVSYLKIIANSPNHEPYDIARKLYFTIKDAQEYVDWEQREQATAERKRLNGRGYSGKADH